MRLYVASQGTTEGPLTPEEVVRRLRALELAAADEVSLEGTPEGVTVRTLLRGRSRTQADAAMSEFLPPVGAPASRARPSPRRLFTTAEVLACLPGFGAAGAGLGGGLMALFCIVFYLWGTFSMNASGARQQKFDELRKRVIRHVDAHPEIALHSLDDLKQAGAVNEDDLKVLDDLGAEYVPVGAATPADGLMFRRTSSSMRWRYYKGGGDDLTAWWTAPRGGCRVVSLPAGPGARSRVVQIADPAGQVLAEYETAASTVWPMWRRDGRFVAINESGRRDGPERFTLWRINGGASQRLNLPDAVEPRRLLEPKDEARAVRWYADRVHAEQWLPDGTLAIESACGARFSDNPLARGGSVHAHRGFVLSVDDEGRTTVVREEKLSYQVVEPPQPKK